MKAITINNGIQCPTPQFDYDKITLGHGSGGLMMHRLLDAGVFKILQNKFLDQAHDGAFLQLEGPTAFSTDSFVVSPIMFPGGNIGELAVNGTVNDIAMCGAIPKYLSLSFILEEGLLMTEFETILNSINQACKEAGVLVVTGDTKVVEKGKGDKIFINTTGIGSIHPNASIRMDRIQPGDVVIVSGNIATHGIAIMSVREGLEFETTLHSDTTNLNDIVHDLLNEFGDTIRFLRDPTRGGVASSLNEICQATRLGIDLKQKDLPFEDAVEGACELLGLDPLYVANEGIFLAIVQSSEAEWILQRLRQHGKGRNAAIIGTVTRDHPSQVIIESTIGGRRVVNMLAGEQLPRIC